MSVVRHGRLVNARVGTSIGSNNASSSSVGGCHGPAIHSSMRCGGMTTSPASRLRATRRSRSSAGSTSRWTRETWWPWTRHHSRNVSRSARAHVPHSTTTSRPVTSRSWAMAHCSDSIRARTPWSHRSIAASRIQSSGHIRAAPVVPASRVAMVVFPEPGSPHTMVSLAMAPHCRDRIERRPPISRGQPGRATPTTSFHRTLVTRTTAPVCGESIIFPPPT